MRVADFESGGAGFSVRRRTFLQGVAGLVGVTILGAPAVRAENSAAPLRVWSAQPGVASERIDGRAKVTGQKVFARDFNARDLPGWVDEQWHAMYLCALTTEHAFLGVDLSSLPPEARPTRVVLGDQLTQSQRAPKLRRTRDLMVEALAREAVAKVKLGVEAVSADLNSVIEYDLIVKPGAVPNFLGQGVALLMFDSLARYRAARRLMQFRDADFQIYALDNGASFGMDKPYSPQTTYVKFVEDGKTFSYATSDPKTYMDQVPIYRGKIRDTLAQHPEFIRQEITVDTQAMEPMFMEPEAGLVWHESKTSSLHILLGTQSPDGDVADIISMYGAENSPLQIRDVVLTSCYPGGGFGGRDSSPFSLLLALAAAFSDGRPVKLAHDRFEQFRLGLKRPGAKIRGALVGAPNMKLQCVEATLNFNGGGLKNLSPYVANLASLCIGGAYEIPMADIFAQSVHTQDIPGGSQRGFGGPEAFFAVRISDDTDEQAVDRIMKVLRKWRDNYSLGSEKEKS